MNNLSLENNSPYLRLKRLDMFASFENYLFIKANDLGKSKSFKNWREVGNILIFSLLYVLIESVLLESNFI